MRNSKSAVQKKIFSTPLGWAGVAASDKGIVKIILPKKNRETVARELGSSGSGARSQEGTTAQLLNKAVVLLQKYFSGAVLDFDVQVDVRSSTVFQQAVWRAAVKIPFGQTRSYAWVARKIGNPKAARAVGQAMGANPVPVLIP